MKHFRHFLLFSILSSAALCSVSQVETDKAIQFTGTGSDASIQGIQSVTNSQDATSVESIQKGSFLYSTATGSNGNFDISVTPAISSYQAGMVFHFISNHRIEGSSTLNVNGLGAVPIKKLVSADLVNCDIMDGQIVTVIHDGVNFQMTSVSSSVLAPTVADAGTDKVSLGEVTTILGGNTATSGTGIWTIVSGPVGVFSDPTDAHSTFTVLDENLPSENVLRWTISSEQCGSTYSEVNISVSDGFDTPGGPYTFVVPEGVTSIRADVYGAQGGSYPEGFYYGGLGGHTRASLTVTPGEELYIYVGEQPTGDIGGFNGGGNGAGTGKGGGGASDIRSGGMDLSSRIIVGGGGGGVSAGWGIAGGAGGGVSGGQGTSSAGPSYCGSGGTATEGGEGEVAYQAGGDGLFGIGGDGGSSNGSGGGGGGGYYGGGGGDAGSGGGGSGFVTPYGSSGIIHFPGVRSGHGLVTLTW